MTDIDNAAHVIRDLATITSGHEELTPGKIYAYRTPSGPMTVNLTADQFLEYPRRKEAYVTVTDVASFAQYYAKHADEDSEVFADDEPARGHLAAITAVLDAHGADSARWQNHRLTFELKATPEWQAWTGSNTRMMNQAAFAEFLEDHIADIAPDGPCTGADLLEMAQQFQAHTKVTFSSGHRIASGQTQFIYSETIEAKAGERGTITIPGAFEIGVRVFADLDPYRVKARFRYRMADGKLTLGYHLDDPERKVRDAVDQVVKAAEEATSATIMRGRP